MSRIDIGKAFPRLRFIYVEKGHFHLTRVTVAVAIFWVLTIEVILVTDRVIHFLSGFIEVIESVRFFIKVLSKLGSQFCLMWNIFFSFIQSIYTVNQNFSYKTVFHVWIYKVYMFNHLFFQLISLSLNTVNHVPEDLIGDYLAIRRLHTIAVRCSKPKLDREMVKNGKKE